MERALKDVLSDIAARYGAAALEDGRRVRALLADLAAAVPKPQKNALIACVEHGFPVALRNTEDRAGCIARLSRELREEEGFSAELCEEAVRTLAAALFGEEKPRKLCAVCGKELEEDWRACPYCGTAWGAAEPSPPPPTAPPLAARAALATPAEPAASPAPAKKRTLRYALIATGVVVAVIAGAAVYQQQQARAEAERVAAERAERSEMARIEAEQAAARAAGIVRIPGGTFTMGIPANEGGREYDETQHQVTVSAFYMGEYEVTQREWREVMGSNPSRFKGDNLPVENVSGDEAVKYCNRRSQREGLTPAYTINGMDVRWNRNADGYRLPTEAEWEYACRSGTTTPFNTGNNITTNQANYDGNYPYNNNAKGIYRKETVNVGSFAPNGWGLYDMHGNVWEWCWDWFGDYTSGAEANPTGPSTGALRVLRGGSWDSGARHLRSADRHYIAPSGRVSSVGFRLVRP
jgi:formylglycine-generating enzyme required for sulfatase activity